MRIRRVHASFAAVVLSVSLLLGLASQVGADPRATRTTVPTQRLRRGERGLEEAVRGAYPGVATRSRVNRRGVPSARVRRGEASRGIGVRQTLRMKGRRLVLETRLSERVRATGPALANALRRFRSSVLLSRTPNRSILQGPVRETAAGPRYEHIEVEANGVTTTRLVDARTGRTVPGSRELASRDWHAHPAVVKRAAAPVVYAVSDIHGGYENLVRLLTRYGLLEGAPSDPAAARWSGGTAKLVVVGDMINKEAQSLATLDLIRGLQTSATASGGEVIVTLGNHEAGFLVEPDGGNADEAGGIARELSEQGLDPHEIASASSPRGRWLRELPFAARIGRWLFVHSGDTEGRTLAEIERSLHVAVDAHDFDHPDVLGRGSLLRSRGWHEREPARVAENASAADVDHIVFGHDPQALGEVGDIAAGHAGALFRIDTGMSPGVAFSEGSLLRITTRGAETVAESLRSDGGIVTLWRGPAERRTRQRGVQHPAAPR